MTATERGWSDELILAAVDRAHRHGSPDSLGVIRRTIADHLGLADKRSTPRVVIAALDRMVEEGLLERCRQHGVQLLALTSTARERLREPAGLAAASALPESPQHRRWRQARRVAREELGGVCEELRASLKETEALLDAVETSGSDAWFALAVRLGNRSRWLGSAVHCLHEWPEPGDEHADFDYLQGPGDGTAADDELEALRSRRIGRREIVKDTRRLQGRS